MSKPIQFSYSNDNHIAILRVNRPQARNALNWEAQQLFAEAVQQVAEERPRVLIITGSGSKAFVSGGDLQELANAPGQDNATRLYTAMGDALDQLTRLPTIVIGAVNGTAAGGGVEILTACDLRISVPTAKFHFVQVRMGLTSGWGAAGRLVKLLGHSHAANLWLNARSVDAAELKSIGFLHRITADGEDLNTAAMRWAHELVALPAAAQQAMKRLLYFASESNSAADVLNYERQFIKKLYSGPDNKEAIAAFFDKRPAQFDPDVQVDID